MATIKVIELFAGGGGFRLGMSPNMQTVLAVEKDEDIAGVYADNFGSNGLLVEDVSKVKFGTNFSGVDLIVGGPPCQDYSIANQTKNTESERSQLGLEMLRAIEETMPKVFILENVRGFSRSKVWLKFQHRCLTLGYKISCGILKALDYGAPQSRERFIAIGCVGKVIPKLPFPTHDEVGGFLFKPWGNWWDAIADLKIPVQELAPFQKKAMGGELKKIINDGGTVLIPRVGYNPKIRLPYRLQTEPAFTIRAFGHKNTTWAKYNVCRENSVYLASPRCLARWQTFPDTYKLPDSPSLAGKVIGNAIPPLLAKAIIDANFSYKSHL